MFSCRSFMVSVSLNFLKRVSLLPPWYCLLVFCFQFHLLLLFIYSPLLPFYGFLKCGSLDYWFEMFPTMRAPINPFYYIYTFGAINFPQSCFSCTSQVSVLFSFSLTLMFSFSWAFFWPMDYLKLCYVVPKCPEIFL